MVSKNLCYLVLIIITIADKVIKTSGYTIAPSTINNDYYITNEIRITDDYKKDLTTMTPIDAVMEDCIPERITVPIKDRSIPNVFYNPPRVRIERCGGFCRNKNQSCQPVNKTIKQVKFRVQYTNYTDQNDRSVIISLNEIVPIEKHTNCSCMCILKKEDCKTNQHYNPRQCRCQCKEIERKRCQKKNYELELKKWSWNPKTCECECVDHNSCTSGYTFDNKSCTCIEDKGL